MKDNRPLYFHKGKPCIYNRDKFCQENSGCENCNIKAERENKDLIAEINSMIKEATK